MLVEPEEITVVWTFRGVGAGVMSGERVVVEVPTTRMLEPAASV